MKNNAVLKNRFVAVFDILGFSNLLKDEGTEKLYKFYNRSLEAWVSHSAVQNTMLDTENNALRPDLNSQRVGYKIFSDTIIYWTEGDSIEDFVCIMLSSLKLLALGFNKAGLRGAIGYGDFIADGDIFLGTAIVDAYEGEQSQVWSGCILTKNCENFCKQVGFFEEYDALNKILVRYPVPKQIRNKESGSKSYEKEEAFCIDWTTHWRDRGVATKGIRDSVKNHEKLIKQNTIAFEEWARNRS